MKRNLMLKRANKTFEQLSKELGISVASLKRYLTERRKCPVERALKIADALGVSVEEIWGCAAADHTVGLPAEEDVVRPHYRRIIGRRVRISTDRLENAVGLKTIADRIGLSVGELRRQLSRDVEVGVVLAVLLEVFEFGLDPQNFLDVVEDKTQPELPTVGTLAKATTALQNFS